MSGNLGLIKRHLSLFVLLALIGCSPGSCTGNGPGSGIRWQGYPALTQRTISYPWLIVKCRLSDVPDIPVGLDLRISQFFGISGAGYGNIVDYFHDISYNRASVIANNIVGWVASPISSGDLAFPNGRLRMPGQRMLRVQECLDAIPEDQLPDLESYYGVAVINNAQQDGGACYGGQQTLTVRRRNYQLACLWFDTGSLITGFAAHEFGHALGLDHSYDDSARKCDSGGQPGEYCDPWDIMSALITYQFLDRNWQGASDAPGAGPGLNAPGLLRMGWVPSSRVRRFDYEGDAEQTFVLQALSRPAGPGPLIVTVDVGSTQAFEGHYTVEYRQSEGWDRGFANAPVVGIGQTGGVVLVHRYRAAGAPASTLINGAFAGALQPCDSLMLRGTYNIHVSVVEMDPANGTATVSIGFGRERFRLCGWLDRGAASRPLHRAAPERVKAQIAPRLPATQTSVGPSPGTPGSAQPDRR